MSSNGRTWRVLIADDSPEMRARLIDGLSDISHIEIIGPASDGDEALELFQSQIPDVAVVDVQMPGAPMAEVVESMRKHSDSALLIAISIHDSDEYRQRFIGLGADHFLSKRSEIGCLADLILRHKSGKQLP